jgi:hypothetical protein
MVDTLRRRHELAEAKRDLRAGIIACAVLNQHRGKDARLVNPSDLFPGLAAVMGSARPTNGAHAAPAREEGRNFDRTKQVDDRDMAVLKDMFRWIGGTWETDDAPAEEPVSG